MDISRDLSEWSRQEWDLSARQDFMDLMLSPSRISRAAADWLRAQEPTTREDIIEFFVARASGEPVGPDLLYLDEQWKTALASYSVQPFRSTIDKNELVKEVRNALSSLLGPPLKAGASRRAWMHVCMVDGIEVLTDVDCGGRTQLKYHHYVSRNGVRLTESRIHWFGWLGLSSQTDFTLIQPGGEHQAAELLRTLCDRFLAAVPRLFGNH